MNDLINPVLKVRNLKKIFGRGCPRCDELTGPEAGSQICPACKSVVALNRVSFDLYPGEILGLVGESGSGKSTIVQSIYFDQKADGGEVFFEPYDNGKENILNLPKLEKRKIRNQMMGMVYQNPLKALQLDCTSGGNIAEKLIYARQFEYRKIRKTGLTLLQKTELSGYYLDKKPRILSGGMQQRVQIAKALANQPVLLLLDEVTTGLDLSVQAKVLDLIRTIKQELGISMIVVSHDFGVIRLLTDRTIVLKNGQVVESGLTDQILEDPIHSYTQLLVHSMI